MIFLAQAEAPHQTLEPSTFGAGGSEPYAVALRNSEGALYLRRTLAEPHEEPFVMDTGRWSAAADVTDLFLLSGIAGPVLDIGCGPGRMVRAAMDLGLSALGIDVSPAAVRMAKNSGLRVLRGSVFDPMPMEGAWATALLVDGNIGIGGDPTALLTRCAALLAPDGALLVELSKDPTIDDRYTATIESVSGGRSAVFPWAELGLLGLRNHADGAGFVVAESWQLDGRSFAQLLHV